MYPGERFGVPEDIASDYLNVLIIGSATRNSKLTNLELNIRLLKLGNVLGKLFEKHLSDSPGVEDNTRFSIELLETALKIAKGELVP